MNRDSSTECWNQITANEWIEIAQNNDFRNYYIMPYTIEKLGDVGGKSILDLGCGDGGYARALARLGASVTAVDCSNNLVQYAQQQAEVEGLSIKHLVCNANNLHGIPNQAYDIVLCSMMLMDVEDLSGTLKEIHRVIKPKGRVFISILHPCFKGKATQWIVTENGIEVHISDYHHPKEWIGEIKGIQAPVIYRHRTISDYVKTAVENHFSIVDMNEPIPTEEQSKQSSRVAWLQKIPMYLFIELES